MLLCLLLLLLLLLLLQQLLLLLLLATKGSTVASSRHGHRYNNTSSRGRARGPLQGSPVLLRVPSGVHAYLLGGPHGGVPQLNACCRLGGLPEQEL